VLGLENFRGSPPEVSERLQQFYRRAIQGFLPPGVLLLDVSSNSDEAPPNLNLGNYIETIKTQIPADIMQFSFS
jgi:hypothetical protein